MFGPFLAAILAAQIGSAGIAGFVTDPSGGVIRSAAVTLSRTDTGETRRVQSNESGLYTVGPLPPGEYRLTVTAIGFGEAARAVRLVTGETLRVDVVLTLESLAAQVTVAAPAPNDAPGLGHVVGDEQVRQIPLNGRSFVSLVALAPGVALPQGSAFPRINGGRPRTNEYLFDGIAVLQPEPGQVPILPLIDSIQEFRIERNSPSAEFGRFNGGVVNLTTRSGTNALTGNAFGFLRHEALNARNLFAPTTAARPGKPLYRRTQAGAVAGGPIVHDRAFFFAEYQGTRQRAERVVTSTVPTLLQREGTFTEAIYDPVTRAPFANRTIPHDQMDPAALALLQRYPQPTSPGTANNFTRAGNERLEQDQYGLRLDARLSEANRMFARVAYLRELVDPVAPLPDGSGSIGSGALGLTRTKATSLASSDRHAFANGVLQEIRFGYTRRAVVRRGVEMPTIVIPGLQQLGSPGSTRSDFRTDVTQLFDAVSWTRGRHTMKSGVDLRWERLDIVQPPSPNGLYRFSPVFTGLPGVTGTGSSLASFLLGQVESYSRDIQDAPLRPRAHIEEYFVQDDWRPTSAFTINGGVRYTLNVPSTEAADRAAVFNLQTRQLDFLGRDGHPRTARDLEKTNFGPRLAIAARPWASTTIRSGYALIWFEQAGITTPFTTPFFPYIQTVTERTLDNVHPAFVLAGGPRVGPLPISADAGLGQGVFAVDRRRGSGYAQQWHAAWQREIGDNVSLELAYAGSRISRLGVPDTNLNQLTVEQLALGSTLLQQVPNPFFGIIPRNSSLGDQTISAGQLLKPFPQHTTVSLYRNNVGRSTYHAFEARIERRFARGLSFQASYTRSRLMDDASSVFDAAVLTGPPSTYPAADSFNRTLEWDLSAGDIPHVFVANAVWDLPFSAVRGWTVTGVLTLQSGLPLPVTQAVNFNAFAGFGTQRPNQIGNPELPEGQRSVQRWFDASAFTTTPQFAIGTSSRNPVRGPGYRNLDLAVIRRIAVSPRKSLELRAEVFNATNTPPLGTPNTVVGTPGVGSITSAGDPRVVQFAAKVWF
jgi:carboxypeptidase family protein